jgi:hypothetical protein
MTIDTIFSIIHNSGSAVYMKVNDNPAEDSRQYPGMVYTLSGCGPSGGSQVWYGLSW